MSTDTFEDTLRDLLRDTADAAGPGYLEPDAGSVIGLGRRAVRRRRLFAGFGAAALATAISLVGWTGLSAGIDLAPAPAGSATTAPTGDRSAADFAMPGVARVRVELDRSTGRVRYLVPRNGQLTVVAEGRVPDTPRGATWVTPASVPGLTIGLTPTRAIDRVLLWSGADGGGVEGEAPLPESGFTAFAIWSGDSPATTAIGLDWTDGEHFYDSAGDELPGGRRGEILTFVDRSLGTWGYFDENGSAYGRFRDLQGGELPVLLIGESAAGDAVSATLLIVLPTGASEVSIEPGPEAVLTSLDTFSGTADRPDESLVLAQITAPLDLVGKGLGHVIWTSADGSAGAGSLNG